MITLPTRLFNNREVTMTLSLSLADQIALELRADIIAGRLLPGMALIEAELVKAYNASRKIPSVKRCTVWARKG